MTLEQAQAAGRVKYVTIMLQYAGAKLQKEKLYSPTPSVEYGTAYR